jgi:hypothetical protein
MALTMAAIVGQHARWLEQDKRAREIKQKRGHIPASRRDNDGDTRKPCNIPGFYAPAACFQPR